MPKNAVMLDDKHHTANLNDGVMLSGLLIKKISLFTCSLNVAPKHKSPQDKPDG
jgi:hypothetical protein